MAEENGKLLGHQNLNQKIQYLVKLKKEYAKLAEVCGAGTRQGGWARAQGKRGGLGYRGRGVG